MTDASYPPTEPPLRPERAAASSLVIVNTGDGKGKTTAAMGTALRARARGWNVCVVQFVKSGRWRTGEEEVAHRMGIDWWTIGDGFTWDSQDLDASRDVASRAWRFARDLIEQGRHDLVVLDEITYPMNWSWIDTADVVAVITARPPHVHVVATGRNAPAELLDVADTVTEMVNVRHAFDRGVGARRGIDY
jgi:cob(I)alamin adenosyltransferase